MHIYHIIRFKIKDAAQEAHSEGLQLRIGSCPDCLRRPCNFSSPKLVVPLLGLEVAPQKITNMVTTTLMGSMYTAWKTHT